MDDNEHLDPELDDTLKASLFPQNDEGDMGPSAFSDLQGTEAGRGERFVPIMPKPVIEDLNFRPDPVQLIKAAIFASPEYVTIGALKELLDNDWDAGKIKDAVKSINKGLSRDNEPFEIVEANNSFCFRTRPQYRPWIKQLFKQSSSRKLSQAALEILALVAYKQPITKAEIEEIRGVSVDGVLKGLLERKLITITGRSDKIGNALNYGTTKEFLRYFGINRVPHDLPKLSEFEDLINSSALLPQVSRSGQISEPGQDQTEEE